MSKKLNTRNIALLGILVAITIVLQLFSEFVKYAPLSPTLSLVPIAISAIIMGPVFGLICGSICGFVCIFLPSTGLFIAHNAFATVLVCILKMGLAGLASGYIYKGVRKKNVTLAVLLAAVSVPLINSSLFLLGSVLFFIPAITQISPSSNAYEFLVFGIIMPNFILEFIINLVLFPAVERITNVYFKHYKKR